MYGRNGITEEWGKLNDQELHNLYYVPETVRLIRWRMLHI
jgi:hypothetical protein